MMEVFMCAIAQRKITPKHHFYRLWHGNLITVMHGFPVSVIIAFFGGSPFSRHACADALTQGEILRGVCRASPAYAGHAYIHEGVKGISGTFSLLSQLSLKGSTWQEIKWFPHAKRWSANGSLLLFCTPEIM